MWKREHFSVRSAADASHRCCWMMSWRDRVINIVNYTGCLMCHQHYRLAGESTHVIRTGRASPMMRTVRLKLLHMGHVHGQGGCQYSWLCLFATQLDCSEYTRSLLSREHCHDRTKFTVNSNCVVAFSHLAGSLYSDRCTTSFACVYALTSNIQSQLKCQFYGIKF